MNTGSSVGTPDEACHGELALRNPAVNKDTAFTLDERDALGLRGLLPSSVLDIGRQITLELEHICSKADPLERYIGLVSLLDRNETLFYRLLIENLDRFTPIIYTPTVGLACQHFSHILRRPRGLYLCPDDCGRIADCFRNVRGRDIRLIVVTDNERILGLGDQGVGGMAICIGKLILYSAGAGIHPSHCLPVTLDVGTDNAPLLEDPYYLGYRRHRMRGSAYDSFIEEFVQAVRSVFPKALLQWEDFKKATAFRLLARYADQLPSFNDDIQGTAAVVLAGILAGLRITQQSLGQQRILYLGAGAAGVGIARIIRLAMKQDGLSEQEIRLRQIHFDSRGLVWNERGDLDEHKRDFTWNGSDLAAIGMTAPASVTLPQAIDLFRPTVLIGTTGEAGVFDSRIISAVSSHCQRPIIFPLSNPTHKAECTPMQAILYSGGRALVATGSPFEPVMFNNQLFVIGQSNNVFIFPGVGMGALVSEASRVTDSMFLAAARELGTFTSDQRLASGALYPDIKDLRVISRQIAFKVAQVARAEGLGRDLDDAAMSSAIDQAIWHPDYGSIQSRPKFGSD
ncbi:MAG: NAD-dependent malic enzyme [Verrucomicrobia bacterium]|nr:NAD-dependent malic enzyme [Verrucomicrobiota bacterium]